jgi:hypothetical protein
MNQNESTTFSMRSYSGGVSLLNCNTTDSKTTIELIAGQVKIDQSCTDGYIDIRGIGYLTDKSNGSTINTNGFMDSKILSGLVTDAVWDEPILDHQITGSTGHALYNVSAGADPYLIANSVWNYDITTTGFTENSAGYMLRTIFDVQSGDTIDIEELKQDVKRILGLTQENIRITDHIYDDKLNVLQSAKIKIFNDSNDCENNTNPLAEYSMSALYDAVGRLTNYKVIKI